MTLHAIVAALGGDLYQNGRRANVPGPGHSRRDRSVSLLLAEGRVVVHGFGGADWRVVRDDLCKRGLIDPRGPAGGRCCRRSVPAETRSGDPLCHGRKAMGGRPTSRTGQCGLSLSPEPIRRSCPRRIQPPFSSSCADFGLSWAGRTHMRSARRPDQRRRGSADGRGTHLSHIERSSSPPPLSPAQDHWPGSGRRCRSSRSGRGADAGREGSHNHLVGHQAVQSTWLGSHGGQQSRGLDAAALGPRSPDRRRSGAGGRGGGGATRTTPAGHRPGRHCRPA